MTSDLTDPAAHVDVATRQKPVLVGYDGSENSKQATLWAARYAIVAGAPLVIVHSWVWPLFTQDLGPVTGIEDSGLRREAQNILAEGRSIAAQAEPDLVVGTRLIVGFPAEALTRLSAGASLLVTGTRGLGGFAGLLVGSTSLHLAASASCPIMVIRDARPTSDSVVAAIDGSPESDRALFVAADLASAFRKSLHLLHVRHDRRRDGLDPSAGEGDPVLDRAVALLGDTPGVHLTTEAAVASSIPGHIVQRGGTAAYVVLGAKGGNTLGARLGSTVHAVLHHARGNVAVVR